MAGVNSSYNAQDCGSKRRRGEDVFGIWIVLICVEEDLSDELKSLCRHHAHEDTLCGSTHVQCLEFLLFSKSSENS